MVIGSILEWYDMYIYAQAAALLFGSLFFPTLSPTVALLASFAALGVGYLARPLGAVIFGYVGDRFSRKTALIATLWLMGLSTVAIGVLPTYAQVGILAPTLLVLLRFLQGMGAGAEYAGAFVLVAETAPVRSRGFWSAMPGIGVYLGLATASIVGATLFSMPDDFVESWGWRIPFLLSSLLIMVGMYLRSRTGDSTVLKEITEDKHRRLPFISIFTESPSRLLLAAALTAPIAFNVYVTLTYGLSYAVSQDFTSRDALMGTVIAALVAVITVPLAGYCSDRFGRRPTYITISILSGFVGYVYFAALNSGSVPLFFLVQALAVSPLVFSLTGAQAAFLVELFGPASRYTGVAMSRELCTAIFTAFNAVVAVALVEMAGGSTWLLSTAMLAVSLAGAIAAYVLPETRGSDLTAEEIVR
ncbi:MFS transporter [Rhodococcus rhodochrous]|uniref:MFS transporter n=2 Tax=Rhodococcus rhodochrous TaxID=1829 RepID=A0AAW4XMY7_RHORH|nr:MFS transporter [Rhodococcus rhodochrous]